MKDDTDGALHRWNIGSATEENLVEKVKEL